MTEARRPSVLSEPPPSAAIEKDADTGWSIVVLRHRSRAPGQALEARIAPAAGGNLFSLRSGEDQLLVQPAKLADLRGHRSGTPILFPTPCRVSHAQMVFAGRRYVFEPNSGDTFIHGLARLRPWGHEAPRAGPSGASVKIFLDWDPSQPDFNRFPLEHRLEVTYTLRAEGLRIAFVVHNRDREPLPFGFGVHPWFRVPGARKDVFLEVPADRRMELEDKLPTGQVLEVQGTPFDLRRPTPLEALDLDDVYLGMTPRSRASFEWRDRGLKVTFRASDLFTHMVVGAPPGQPFFIMENLTSSPDAHNLHTHGHPREAHVVVADPGRRVAGWIDWQISRTPAAVPREARP